MSNKILDNLEELKRLRREIIISLQKYTRVFAEINYSLENGGNPVILKRQDVGAEK